MICAVPCVRGDYWGYLIAEGNLHEVGYSQRQHVPLVFRIHFDGLVSDAVKIKMSAAQHTPRQDLANHIINVLAGATIEGKFWEGWWKKKTTREGKRGGGNG